MSLTATEDEEDDNELRDMVSGVLDAQGVLGRIKAELRAHVFLALEGGKEVRVRRTLAEHVQFDLKFDLFSNQHSCGRAASGM